MTLYKIWYGRYGRRSKIVKAEGTEEIYKKYLDVDQIEKVLTKNLKKVTGK